METSIDNNPEKNIEIKQELIQRKLQKSGLNANQKHILKNKIAGDKCEEPYEKVKEVYETLLSTPPKEDGGRNALFGFYYQFLVAIDYIIELAEGKWSFMAFEIHDDIVLCKEDEDQDQSCVRFVQVKTSQNPVQLYTSELCARTNKEFVFENGKKGLLKINDSWLDKLFLNAKIFENSPKIVQQFQLITNFAFHVHMPKKSETKNINHYRENKLFSDIEIKDDDPFLKHLSLPVFNNEGKEFDYESHVNMSVKELLGRTQILEQRDHLSSYRDVIRTRLGDLLSKKLKTEAGATIVDDDINWLIGEMIANCSERDDKLVLFIDQERAMSLEKKLLKKAITYSEEFSEVAGNKKYIDNAFDKILHEVLNSKPEHSENFEQIALSVKQKFYNYIEEGGTVLQLISRFYEGREESIDFHVKMHKSLKEESVYALTVILLLLSVINEEVYFSSKHKDILAKKVVDSLGGHYLTLLKIKDDYYYEDVVKKLNGIITRLHGSSHADLLLMGVNTANKVIIHGLHYRFDDVNFTNSHMETISLEKPIIPEIGRSEESMNEVNYKFLLIPWYVVDSKSSKLRQDNDDFLIFKDRLIELWKELNKEGE